MTVEIYPKYASEVLKVLCLLILYRKKCIGLCDRPSACLFKQTDYFEIRSPADTGLT